MPSIQQEQGHVLLQSHMTSHIIVAISKSNWLYTVNRSDQLGAVSVEFSFFENQTAIIQAIQQVISRKVRVHRVIHMPLKALGQNQIIRKSANVGKLCYPFLRGPLNIRRAEFCTPSKVKCKRLKPLGFFLYNIFLAAIAFPLNNNICLFVFSECFQITHWRLLDHMHLQFQKEMTYQCRFSLY